MLLLFQKQVAEKHCGEHPEIHCNWLVLSLWSVKGEGKLVLFPRRTGVTQKHAQAVINPFYQWGWILHSKTFGKFIWNLYPYIWNMANTMKGFIGMRHLNNPFLAPSTLAWDLTSASLILMSIISGEGMSAICCFSLSSRWSCSSRLLSYNNNWSR